MAGMQDRARCSSHCKWTSEQQRALERPGDVGDRIGLRTTDHVTLGRLRSDPGAGSEICLPRAGNAHQEDGTEGHPQSPIPRLLVWLSFAASCQL